MDGEYKKRSKGKDKAKRNEQFRGKISTKHVRITAEKLQNVENKRVKVATPP